MSYRSQILRDLAQEAPICFSCGRVNDGTVVGCHSNSQVMGKGMGLKADDLLAYACAGCHRVIDGETNPPLNRQDREDLWRRAAIASTLWLLESGYLVPRRNSHAS